MKFKLTTAEYHYVVETALAWLAALGMLIYGMAKGVQFNSTAFSEVPLAELTGMQLMWAFYAHSKVFAIIIGVLEVSGGILLLFPRWRILGGLLCTTVLVNIILQDIFYGVHLGALKAALVYQAAILGVFFFRREAILSAFQLITTRFEHSGTGKRRWVLLGWALLLFTVLRMLEFGLTIVW